MKRKYYYSVLFKSGIAYIVAVSKEAAERQAKQAIKNNGKYQYQMNTLTRISKREYDKAHGQ